jgi:hypothetical protein
MKKTTVINLLGGPGAGKSTAAAGIYHQFKLMGADCELVREYIKNWAWKGTPIGPYDQFYITGKQSQYESILYGKVDYIITDSPIILGAIYDEYYSGKNVFLTTLMDFIDNAQNNGVTYHYYLLRRYKPYHNEGRYQNEDEAKHIDGMIEDFMKRHKIDYTEVDMSDEHRPSYFKRFYLGE